MNPDRTRVDLHVHSDRSDGRHSPEQLLRAAARRGLDVLAITDHDLPPVLPGGARQVDGRVVHLVEGVELTASLGEAEIHLLAWFPAGMPAAFRSFCAERARWRAARYERLRQALGHPALPPADADALAGRRALTRHHLARACVRAGLVRTRREAWGRLASCGPPLPAPPAREVLRRIREAGGVAAWAHPPPPLVEAHGRRLAKGGLDAIEAIRPRQGRTLRRQALRRARRLGLEVSGGSDHHGWDGCPLGLFAVSGRQVTPLLARLGLA